MGLLNIALPWQIHAEEETAIISWRECENGKLLFRERLIDNHGPTHETPDDRILFRIFYCVQRPKSLGEC